MRAAALRAVFSSCFFTDAARTGRTWEEAQERTRLAESPRHGSIADQEVANLFRRKVIQNALPLDKCRSRPFAVACFPSAQVRLRQTQKSAILAQSSCKERSWSSQSLDARAAYWFLEIKPAEDTMSHSYDFDRAMELSPVHMRQATTPRANGML
jgi:hypothetical protein